jgi:hypothetical protein
LDIAGAAMHGGLSAPGAGFVKGRISAAPGQVFHGLDNTMEFLL